MGRHKIRGQMTNPDEMTDRLQREALDWVIRLTSGAATVEDADALQKWRGLSAAHARAFAEAARLRRSLRDAVREPDVNRGAVILPLRPPRNSRTVVTRRALLGGAIAASAVGMIARPPLGLWPSLAELTADYRTGIGEQRRVALSDGVSVQLNTQTSIAVRPTLHEHHIELISGEAAVTTAVPSAQRFVMIAGNGRANAVQANFTVRRDGDDGCVTCVDGEVQVEHGGGLVRLGARQQVTYTKRNVGSVVAADPEVATAWRRGLLVFHDVPLNLVVEEINRYRPGKIILVGSKLGSRLVNGVFQVDRIEGVIDQLRNLSLTAKSMPGGIVLVS